MSLDLFSSNIDDAVNYAARVSAPSLPSTFDENFRAAWSDGLLFSQSNARANARAAVLGDYVSEIRQKTGQDLSKEFMPDAAGGGQTGVTDFATANARVAKMKADYPDLDLAPLDDAEIDKRALTKAQASHRNYQALQAGEKTAGGSFGSFLGSAAAGVADPINIIGLPIAPEAAGIGILSTALRWGALAGVSQAAIEFASDDFKEQVQPGYTESGEPIKEIGGAFLGGAVVGGSIKALGNAWTRVKTGQWPTSVRDAGNVIESEANIAETNPFAASEEVPPPDTIRMYRGEGKQGGGPVFAGSDMTGGWFTTDINRARLYGEPKYVDVPKSEMGNFAQGALGPDVYVTDNPKFRDALKPFVTSSLGVDGEVAHREALVKTIDDILAGRPVDVGAQITPELQQAAAEADRARAMPASEPGMPTQQIELPLSNPFPEIVAKAKEDFDVNGVFSNRSVDRERAIEQQFGKPEADAYRAEYDRLSNEAVAARKKLRAGEAPQPPLQSAEEMNRTLTDAGHQDAIRADIDRERAMGDVQVPGIDENGNHTMVSVDAGMEQVDAYKRAAEQIQACANPPAEEGQAA